MTGDALWTQSLCAQRAKVGANMVGVDFAPVGNLLLDKKTRQAGEIAAIGIEGIFCQALLDGEHRQE